MKLPEVAAVDHNELVNKRVNAIARAHDCTIDDVHAALDRHPIELDRDRFLKRTLALELMRLDQLEMAFKGKAIKDRDPAAGALMVKILERPPMGHAVQVIQHEPAQKKTTLEEARARMDAFMAAPKIGIQVSP